MNNVQRDRVLLEGLVRKYGKKDVLNYVKMNEARKAHTVNTGLIEIYVSFIYGIGIMNIFTDKESAKDGYSLDLDNFFMGYDEDNNEGTITLLRMEVTPETYKELTRYMRAAKDPYSTMAQEEKYRRIRKILHSGDVMDRANLIEVEEELRTMTGIEDDYEYDMDEISVEDIDAAIEACSETHKYDAAQNIDDAALD